MQVKLKYLTYNDQDVNSIIFVFSPHGRTQVFYKAIDLIVAQTGL
jgi:hypothetical protein